MDFWEELKERLRKTDTRKLLQELQELDLDLKLDKSLDPVGAYHFEAHTQIIREVLLARAYPELEEEEGRRPEDDATGYK